MFWKDPDADFELGQLLRERIVPRAVLYFTGEEVECEESEGEDDESEGDVRTTTFDLISILTLLLSQFHYPLHFVPTIGSHSVWMQPNSSMSGRWVVLLLIVGCFNKAFLFLFKLNGCYINAKLIFVCRFILQNEGGDNSNSDEETDPDYIPPKVCISVYVRSYQH